MMRPAEQATETVSEARGSWEPILSGPLADQAGEALHAIAAAGHGDPISYDHYSLPGGSAGRGLFHAYLAEAWQSAAHETTAIELLQRSVEGFAGQQAVSGLHGGVTGVAWTVEHLAGRLLDPQEDLGADTLDDLLAGELASSAERDTPWHAGYDLIMGLVGLGVYALERLPRVQAARCVELIVAQLEALVEERPGGLTWFTPPALLHRTQREDHPDGYYNFGMAHGIPGILAWLGRLHAAGMANGAAGRLLEGGVSWLLAHENPAQAHTRFPTFLTPDGTGGTSRLGWCYGDAGVAAALFCAGRCAGEPRWEREALRIARDAARRPPDRHGVVDAGLCHGSAGLAQIYNRLFQVTGDEALREAALAFYRVTLDLRRSGVGVAGFRSWGPDADEKLQWLDDGSFLTGTAGIGLVLLAGLTPLEPAWDRVLLLSDPAMAAR
jgi:hypothetical protein